jgi:hypothetical protein
MKRLTSLFVISCFVLSSPVIAAEWHVATSGSDEFGSGSSADPFGSVQHGVNIASTGDTILVAAGLYSEHVSFSGKNVVVLSIDGSDQTVLEATLSGVAIVTFSAGESNAAVLDGFTIRNSLDAPGILCKGSSPVIQNCEIHSCSNSSTGGGIRCIGGSSAAIRNNRIHENSSTTGGGIFCEGSAPTITGNIFEHNSAASGGAIGVNSGSDIELTYNLFTYNEATQDGGAIANVSMFGPPLVVQYCTFYQNTSGRFGGALYTRSLFLVVGRSILWEDLAVAGGDEAYPQAIPVSLSHSDVSGDWSGPGTGNSSVDPAFCDAANGDFHLQQGSYLSTYPFNDGNPIGAFGAGCVEIPCDDIDGDGICDEEDNCLEYANADQTDTDGDGIGDVCDNCPGFASGDQTDTDGDGIGDVCDNCPGFASGDGIGDVCDNCPGFASGDQTDTDGDGIGDVCDNCPGFASGDQTDTDGDGIGDACDNCPDLPNADQTDANGDGVGDACTITYSTVFGYVQSGGAPMAGVAVNLLDVDGNEIGSTATDVSGWYSFSDLTAGMFYVHVWPPVGYTADQELREVHVTDQDVQVDFLLTEVGPVDEWRGRGYWMHQVKSLLTGHGHVHEPYEVMCDYLEQILYYFNTHSELPVITCTVDPESDCDQRLRDLQEALRPTSEPTTLNRATSDFVVLLLNIVSGRIAPGANVNEEPPEASGGDALLSGVSTGMTASQAVAFTDALITDGDETNDDLAYLIVRLVNTGNPVPAGWIDPTTPDVDYLMSRGFEGDDGSLPTGFSLGQNYPNPFNPVTNIGFYLPRTSAVRLEIYNMMGQQVATVFDDLLGAGQHVVTWDGSKMSSGVYLYRLEAGDFIETKKMTLLK